MTVKDLNKDYDVLQEKHGAYELNSIYNGGCEENPNIMFVFMNPTGRNIASVKTWQGRRSPWLGTKNIWKLFYEIGLLEENIFKETQSRKSSEWDYHFADLVYEDISKHKYFITNLGKCTQIDARPLPDNVYKEYLELLLKEINIVKPKKIITFGNQVSSIILNEKICVSKCRKQSYKKIVNNIEYKIYPVYYPIGNGMMNISKTIEDLKYVLNLD